MSRNDVPVNVIGGGLSGCEAALTLASAGVSVNLFECRPALNPGVFKTSGLCELVCSNSLGSMKPDSAPGILKAELTALGSHVLAAAAECCVPGGQALCVDREAFSKKIEARISGSANISVSRSEVKSLERFGPEEIVIVATGPLTSESLFNELSRKLNVKLYFYDAVSPIVSADSVDMARAFRANRYSRGTPDYLNIALDKAEYFRFYDELIKAATVASHDNEKEIFFESCMPIEEMARRGPHTLRFGPMKPKGFDDPRTGKMPYAVLQLRAENNVYSAFNLVGFQTKMTFPEQKRVLSLIPGLENVNILRYGVIHKNHYIYSPEALNYNLSLKGSPDIFVAGQLLGSEGYTEAIATGKMAAINALAYLKTGKAVSPLESIEYEKTVIGSLIKYITKSQVPMKKYFPMNANFGIINNALVDRESLPEVSASQIKTLLSLIS